VATRNAFAPGSQKVVVNASPRKKKEILRHCSINPGTTQFALLNDDGNFLKLDENGNVEVMNTITVENSTPGACIKKIRAVVRGSVDGDTLIVRSISKM
jgi:phage gp45-like